MSWCYHTRYKRKKGNNGKKKRHAFNRLVWKAVNLSDIFAARRYDGKRDFRWLFFSCCIEKIAFSTINYVFLLALFGASKTIFPRFRGFCHCFTGGIIVRYSSFSFFAQKALKLNQIEKQQKRQMLHDNIMRCEATQPRLLYGDSIVCGWCRVEKAQRERERELDNRRSIFFRLTWVVVRCLE